MTDQPPSSRPGDVSTRICEPSDRSDQGALYERCFEKPDGESTLRWRYDGNPHGTAISLLSREGDTLLSGYACSPRRVLVRGEEASAALVGETGDVMTTPEARGRGLFSDLDRAAMAAAGKAGWPMVFGLPNRQSEGIFTGKLGWKLVGKIRPYTFVLASDEAARADRMRAGRLASAMTPWSAWRGMMSLGKMRNQYFAKVNVVSIARFDEAVDELSSRVARDFDWMVQRDHEYLNWRFMDAPAGLFRAHGVYLPDGKLCGYVIVQLPGRGERIGYVVDILAADDIAFAAGMDAALGHLKKASASVARSHAIEDSWWETRLLRAGFRRGKSEDFKAVILHELDPEHPVCRAGNHPERWYFTDGDRDDELVR